MTCSQESDCGIAFLGACERSAYVRDGNTNFFKWNVLGLRHIILSYLFPLPLRELSFGFAIKMRSDMTSGFPLQLVDASQQEIGRFNISTNVATSHDLSEVTYKNVGLKMPAPEKGWLILFFTLGNIVIQEPGDPRGRIFILHKDGST